ncbi:MAG: hypothetical protein ACK5IB_13915 [Qingshengfaniella sp.]
MALLAGLALLGACAHPEPPVDPEVWQAAAYRSAGPAEIALVTNINNRTGRGAHSALIIDGPERVVFNPFGTWSYPDAPERGDVHRNFTPVMENWFIDYHARETYRVQVQRVRVPPEVAAEALRRAMAYGAVGPARCTIAVSRVLHGLPGFEDFPVVLYPDRARDNFARIPGVESTIYVDDSPGDWSDLRDGRYGNSTVQAVPEQSIAVAVRRR